MSEAPPAPSSPTRAPAWSALRPVSLTAAEATGEWSEVGARLQRRVGFNPRQLQPGWVESILGQRLQQLGGLRHADYLQRLDQDPAEAEQLVEQLLEPAAWSAPEATVVLRAPTRTLLDGLLRGAPPATDLVVWILAPGCDAVIDHLRMRLASAGQPPRRLLVQGPWAAGDPTPTRMRALLDWLDQATAPDATDGATGANLILVPDLFTHWRPDLQRQWLGRVAASLRSGGLLLQGRPKALWRAPRGLRAVHLDGMHWLQRTTATSPLPAALPQQPALAAGQQPAQGEAASAGRAANPAADLLPHSPTPSAPAAVPTPAAQDTGVLLIDLDRLQLGLTESAARLLGLPPGRTQLSWQDLLDHLEPADQERLGQVMHNSAAAAAGWTLDLVWPAAGKKQPGTLRLQAQPCLFNTSPVRGTGRLLACTLQAQPQADPNRLMVITHLPGAADRQELELQYQPVFQVEGGQLQAVEALVRWRHPELGLVPPRSFIPWAEECGLIDELGRWVLRQACRQAARWRALGLPRVPMAVNLSERQLHQHNFSAQVAQALAESGLPGHALQLELPETDLDRLGEAGVRQLAACRRLGVTLALDDFGGGPGRWQQVQQLPFNSLKLDPRCTHSLSTSGAGREIVQSTVALAHQLGLQVVAEGVESADQLEALRHIGCDAFQGHHAAAAQAPAGMAGWLHG